MKKKLVISEAHSYKDGIAFYSLRHPGYMTKTTINYEGVIKNSFERCEMQTNESKILSKLSTIFSIVIIAISISDDMVWITRVVFLIDVIVTFLELVIGMLAIKYERGRRLEFHGAEHMVINAYNKLGRIPTLDELRGFSRLENDCSSSYVFTVFVSSFLSFISTFIFNGYFRPIAIAIITFLGEVLKRKGELNFIQYATTRKPTDEELKIAIIALQYWEKKEQEDLNEKEENE